MYVVRLRANAGLQATTRVRRGLAQSRRQCSVQQSAKKGDGGVEVEEDDGYARVLYDDYRVMSGLISIK